MFWLAGVFPSLVSQGGFQRPKGAPTLCWASGSTHPASIAAWYIIACPRGFCNGEISFTGRRRLSRPKVRRERARSIPQDVAPIQIAPLQAVDEHLGSGDVGGHRDVVHVAQAQQVHVVGRLVGLGV